VVGAQPEAAATLAECFRSRTQVDVVQGTTSADGLSGNLEPGSITVPLVLDVVDEFSLVSEREIASAVVGLVDNEHLLAEPSAAVAVAALDHLDIRGARVAVIVSGANVGPATLRRLLAEHAAPD
jgi:threonine dehydratase